MHPTTYRVRIKGTVSDDGLDELAGMRRVEHGATTTTLEGTLPDQPALLGIVARVEALGCTVRDLYAVGSPPRGVDLGLVGTGSCRARWQICVAGTVTPLTASLLDDYRVTVVETTTVLEGGPLPANDCTSTVSELQSWGLEVVALHRRDFGPDDDVPT